MRVLARARAQKGLEEHPDSHDLMIFSLLVQRVLPRSQPPLPQNSEPTLLLAAYGLSSSFRFVGIEGLNSRRGPEK